MPNKLKGFAKMGSRLAMAFILWRLSKKPLHGYDLIMEAKEGSFGKFTPASIYPMLAGLEKSGLVIHKERIVEGRARKEYRTTPKGLEMLKMIRGKVGGRPRVKEFLKFLSS